VKVPTPVSPTGPYGSNSLGMFEKTMKYDMIKGKRRKKKLWLRASVHTTKGAWKEKIMIQVIMLPVKSNL